MVVKKLSINEKLKTFTMHVVSGGLDIDVCDEHGEREKLFITNYEYDPKTGIVYYCNNGRSYQAYINSTCDDPEASSLRVVMQGFLPIIVQEQHERTTKPANLCRPVQSVDILKSPIAGRITKVLVSPGQQVCQGQALVLIESMKMENEICTPRAAFIKTIFIQPGNVVQPNQYLIEFEKEGDSNATTKNEYEQKAV